MSNTNTAIKIQGLTKTYKLYDSPSSRLKEALHPLHKKYHRDFEALKDITLSINKGETVGIIGKNGSGKSTLLKIITGVLTPTTGSVEVQGKVSAILELGAGFNPEMTGLENIYLNNALNGLNKNQTDKIINDIIRFAELGDFIHQPLKTYSSGMKARLAFAVSINAEPDVLIVDEALSVGDASFSRKCFAKMEDIRNRGATILFVSHSDASIVSLCNRAIWLNQGENLLEGSPKLVTGLYMKHSHEKIIHKQAVRNEYQALIDSDLSQFARTDIAPGEQKLEPSTRHPETKSAIEEFFNPELKPTSTIAYAEKGARLFEAKVTTLAGKKVNTLKQGSLYQFSYKVNIEDTLTKVQFGFLIKKKDGTPLGGGSFPGRREFIPQLAGIHEIKILFRCDLNTGEYFFNCGVQADIDSKSTYAHRILDAYLIKVIEAESHITESVNFIDNFSISRVN